MVRKASPAFLIALALAFGLVLFSMGLTITNIRSLRQDTATVQRTDQVLLELETLLSLMKDAETGQRGYLITGEPVYLEPYRSALNGIQARLDSLHSLTADDPAQQERLLEVRRRVGAKLGDLDVSIETRRRQGFEAAREIILLGRGKAEMDAIRQGVLAMQTEERRLRERRNDVARSTLRNGLFWGLASGLTALAAILTLLIGSRASLRKRDEAAAAIAAEAEKLRTTLLSIGDAVVTTDTAGRITNLNPIAEALTGFSAAEAIGSPLDERFHIVHETTREPVMNPVTQALQEGRIVALANHTTLISKDGTERPIEDSAAPIKTTDGTVIGCVLVFRDVSARKTMESQLHQSESRLRVTLESIGDGVIATDRQGNVTYQNPVAATLTGWVVGAVGKPLPAIFRLVNEHSRAPVLNAALRAMQEERFIELANHSVLVSKDGRETPIEDSAAPIHDDLGQVSGAVLIFRDVTERRQLARQLEKSEEQFRTLAESIPQLCWMASADGSIYWYNRRWFDYTGTTLEQMQGWGWQSVHDPAVLPEVMKRWQASIELGEAFEMVFPLKGSDGRFRDFLTRVVPVNDDSGVTRWFGTNTEISSITRAQS